MFVGFDKEKLKQAAQEFGFMFIVAFSTTFYGFASGWTKLPNMGEAKAALYAAASAAALSTGKAIFWYFTGTKVRRADEG